MKIIHLALFILTILLLAGCGLGGGTPADGPMPSGSLSASTGSVPGPLTGTDPSVGESSPGSASSAGALSDTASPGTASHSAAASPASDTAGASSPSGASSVNGTSAGEADTFAELHGALSVEGTELVDENGDPIRLYGMSTHGIAWFPQYVSYDTFRTLRDDWDTNCIRLALYSDEYDGYSSGGDQEELKSLVKNGIDYATELGMYVIVDWHVLHDQDPNVHREDALSFFREISSLYGDNTNILYEICNEPNGCATWDSVKSYADEVIPAIRENDPDAVILAGTPAWCQNIDQAAASPLAFDNVMYTLHFYAATHTDDLRSRLEGAVNSGLPVFISEFGMCDASGNGGNDFGQAEKWMELIDKYNLSFFCWNLANKAETSCVLKAGCEKSSDWTEEDLSESGRWIRERFREVSSDTTAAHPQ